MANTEKYTYDKICKIFDSDIPRSTFNSFSEKGVFPQPHIDTTSKVKPRYWTVNHLPSLGKILGFLKTKNKEQFLTKKGSATIITTFTRKGGVLKSTLSFNVARIAALNGYRTLVIGLDSQCDITNMLGYYDDLNEATNTKQAEEILNTKKGLFDLTKPNPAKLSEIIMPTDLSTLYFIPETDEIEELNEHIEKAAFREEWLKNHVIEKLKHKFDLIILDSSPTSGRLVSNAMIVSDLILSPIECSTNNFKNYIRTRMRIDKKLQELGVSDVNIMYIPTKLAKTTISQEIYKTYQALPACSIHSIKVSTAMEASVFNGISIIEHAPTDEISGTMRSIVLEIFQRIEGAQNVDTKDESSKVFVHSNSNNHQELSL